MGERSEATVGFIVMLLGICDLGPAASPLDTRARAPRHANRRCEAFAPVTPPVLEASPSPILSLSRPSRVGHHFQRTLPQWLGALPEAARVRSRRVPPQPLDALENLPKERPGQVTFGERRARRVCGRLNATRRRSLIRDLRFGPIFFLVSPWRAGDVTPLPPCCPHVSK